MQLTLKQAAQMVGGTYHGSDQIIVRGTGTISSARQGEITFADSAKILERLEHSTAEVVLVPSDLRPHDRAYIQVEDVREAFSKLVAHFRPPRKRPRSGISPSAHVSESAKLADDVDIYAGAVIGDQVEIGAGTTIHANVTIMAGCRIAENVTIYPGVVVYEDTIVGARCILHANSVVGAYGFGYESVDGIHQIGAQLGYVELESDVELGAATTIDRGSYGATTIGIGTKVDNQVQIAHNCRIGRHNILCAQVGIAGSSTTGNYVVMAGQVGIPDHVHIGDRSTIGAKSGVMRDVPSGQTMLGIPATPERTQMQLLAALHRLPEMRKQVRAMQRLLDAHHAKLHPDATREAA
jgi:UDP-3-O-[3-hydroxymyristoyl] glucosamine N-acyltransferase